jgi:hypothetical protein
LAEGLRFSHPLFATLTLSYFKLSRGAVMKFRSQLAIAASLAFATAASAADAPRPPAAQAFQIGALQAWTLRALSN